MVLLKFDFDLQQIRGVRHIYIPIWCYLNSQDMLQKGVILTNLHSNMVLLKYYYFFHEIGCESDLHSNMVLLKSVKAFTITDTTITFTFQYGAT